MRYSLILMITMSAISIARSQTNPTGSLLWQISGKNLKQPSYLFGTIHIQDKRVFNYHPNVEEKLKECDVFAMEMLFSGIKPEKLKKAMLMEDKTLDQLLNKKDIEKLDLYMKANLGVGIMMFNKTKPFFISAEISEPLLKQEMSQALDLYLSELAKSNGKKIVGIETFKEQMAAVDKIPLEEQAQILVKGINDTTNIEDKYEEMIITYLNADLEKMMRLSEDSNLPLNFTKIFIDDRNKKMAGRIVRYAKKQPTFFAVGAAHLSGQKGLITLLRRKGYTVTPLN